MLGPRGCRIQADQHRTLDIEYNIRVSTPGLGKSRTAMWLLESWQYNPAYLVRFLFCFPPSSFPSLSATSSFRETFVVVIGAELAGSNSSLFSDSGSGRG